MLAVVGGVTAGVSMAAAGAATIGGFLAVAGGMMAGLGIVSKDKKMQRLGSMLSLAGGIANGLQGAAAASTEASSAWDASGASAGKDAAQFGKHMRPIEGATSLGEAATAGADLGTNLAQAGADIGDFGQLGQSGTLGGAQDAGELAGLGSTDTLAQTYQTAAKPVDGLLDYAAGRDAALEQAAKGMTANDISASLSRATDKASSLMGQAWDGAGKVMNSAGQWVKQNPELAKMGMSAISGAFGPESEAMDYRKSLMERARQNANSPIRLRFQTTPIGG